MSEADTLRKMIELAQDGYEVTLRPGPVPGIVLHIQGGDVDARQAISSTEIEQARVDVVGLALDKMLHDIGDFLEREIRGDDR